MNDSILDRFKNYVRYCAIKPVLIIIGIQCVIFLLCNLIDASTQGVAVRHEGSGMLLHSGYRFSDYLLCDRSLWHGQIWRPVTAMLTHTSFLHLFMNMLLLFFLGRWFIETLSLRTALIIALVAGIIANCIHTLLDPAPVLGFSGANMALLVATTVCRPRDLLFFFPAWLFVSVLVFIDFISFLNSLNAAFYSNTAYDVHLSGALIGLLSIKAQPLLQHWLHKRRQVKARQAAASRSHEMQRVDEILEKISKQGLHMLSDEERRFLKKHSENERKRGF